MTSSEQFVQQALRHKGKPYIFGSEASPLDPDPRAFDCSELVEWALESLGFDAPDGSWIQYGWTSHVPVEQGIRTRGALLFVGTATRVHHVAISLGDGTTIEARGRAWGVGVFSAHRSFDGAGLIPGLTYGAAPRPKPPVNQGGGIGIMPGSDSQAVRFLQQMLNIVRRGSKPRRSLIATDGLYGAQTKAAVAEFQEAWNSVPAFQAITRPGTRERFGKIPHTGGADPETCDAIGVTVRLVLGLDA